jgi:hypothetical protein
MNGIQTKTKCTNSAATIKFHLNELKPMTSEKSLVFNITPLLTCCFAMKLAATTESADGLHSCDQAMSALIVHSDILSVLLCNSAVTQFAA